MNLQYEDIITNFSPQELDKLQRCEQVGLVG